MAGYNGSQLWDTAFTAQAYIAAGTDTAAATEALKKAHAYIKVTQVRQLSSSCGPIAVAGAGFRSQQAVEGDSVFVVACAGAACENAASYPNVSCGSKEKQVNSFSGASRPRGRLSGGGEVLQRCFEAASCNACRWIKSSRSLLRGSTGTDQWAPGPSAPGTTAGPSLTAPPRSAPLHSPVFHPQQTMCRLHQLSPVSNIRGTVQGLKASLLLANMPAAQVGDPMEDQNYKNAADMLLSYQNGNGGWPTYELQRSFAQVGPSSVFPRHPPACHAGGFHSSDSTLGSCEGHFILLCNFPQSTCRTVGDCGNAELIPVGDLCFSDN